MMDNYPPGTYENDPRAPWNAPEPPEWMQFYDSIDPVLPEAETLEEAIRNIEALIGELQEQIEALEA